MPEGHLRKQIARRITLSGMERLHPFKSFLFFALLGSTLVFLSMVFLYSIRVSDITSQRQFQFPKPFILSTIILLLSSFSISKAVQAYKDDAVRSLQIQLLITTALALVFGAFQLAGWIQLIEAGVFANAKSTVTFLYIITGFHLLHVCAGFVGLVYLNYKAANLSGDLVRSLLYFSDKREKTKIELMAIFWHYIDFLWLCLFCMFLYTL